MEKQKPLEIPEQMPKQRFIVLGDYMGLGTAFISIALEQGHEVLFWVFERFDTLTSKVKEWTLPLKKTSSINWFELSDEGVVIVDAQAWSEAKENLHFYSAADVPVIFLDPTTDKNSIINPSNHVLVVSPSPVPEINSLMYDFHLISENYFGLSAKKDIVNVGIDSFIYDSRTMNNRQLSVVVDFSTKALTDAGYKIVYNRLSPMSKKEQNNFLFELEDYSYEYLGQTYSLLFEDNEQMNAFSSMLSTFMSEADHYGEYEKPIVDVWQWSILKKDKTLGFGYRYAGNCLTFMWFSNQQNILDGLFSRYYGLGKFFAICSSSEFEPKVSEMIDLA